MLALHQELKRVLFRVEGQVLRDEVYRDALRNEPDRDIPQGQNPVFFNERVDQVHSVVWRFFVKLEEAAIIALCERFTDFESVLNRLLLLLIRCQLLEHPLCLSFKLTEHIVQHLVSQKLNSVAFELI